VAVLLAQVVHVGLTGLEHSQSEQSKQSDKGKVERIRRRARGDDHRLELEMGQAERRGFVRDGRAAYVRRRRCLEDSVDDTGAIKAGHHRQPPCHGRRLEPADLLQPADEQLNV
jgi:hypothetical protein